MGKQSYAFRKSQFPVMVGLLQIAFIVLIWRFVDYNPTASGIFKPASKNSSQIKAYQTDMLNKMKENRMRYPMFQDVHVMIFVGFGFLMTFLRKYSFSSVSYNLILSAIIIQWSVIVRALIGHLKSNAFYNLNQMILSDFDCAIVLISFGAVLGKTSLMQLLILALIEVPLAQLNTWLAEEHFHIADIGGSMIIHTFGAYYGIAATLALTRRSAKDHRFNGSGYNSDIFSMIGTVFLWAFWPSFNGALAEHELAERAIINTYFALAGATVATFCFSTLSQPRGKFKMVMVQNATLAGGVGVGAVANFMIHPWGALVIGAIAGTVSVFGFSVLQGALERIRIYDTCGVHNLHGMPGLVSGIASCVGAALATYDNYGTGLYHLFPHRHPTCNKTTQVHLASATVQVKSLCRSASTQAWYQFSCLGCTLGIALVGGLITGAIMRLPFLDQMPDDLLFDDHPNWEVPEEEEASAAADSNHVYDNRSFETKM